jgi:hypothetical protein
LDGVVNGGGASVSGNIGDDVYVEQGTDGLLTTTVQLPGGGSVVRVGILDTADGVSGTTPFDIVFDRARLS